MIYAVFKKKVTTHKELSSQNGISRRGRGAQIAGKEGAQHCL